MEPTSRAHTFLAPHHKFLYINSSFSPAPDDTVGNLYKVGRETTGMRAASRAFLLTVPRSRPTPSQCFGTEGHLIVNYSSTAAWG